MLFHFYPWFLGVGTFSAPKARSGAILKFVRREASYADGPEKESSCGCAETV